MNVNLGSMFETFVEDLVKTGAYQSNSEVVREGLRLLRDREDLRKLRLEELRREVQKGIDDIEAGRVVDGNKVFAEIRKMSAEKRRTSR